MSAESMSQSKKLTAEIPYGRARSRLREGWEGGVKLAPTPPTERVLPMHNSRFGPHATQSEMRETTSPGPGESNYWHKRSSRPMRQLNSQEEGGATGALRPLETKTPESTYRGEMKGGTKGGRASGGGERRDSPLPHWHPPDPPGKARSESPIYTNERRITSATSSVAPGNMGAGLTTSEWSWVRRTGRSTSQADYRNWWEDRGSRQRSILPAGERFRKQDGGPELGWNDAGRLQTVSREAYTSKVAEGRGPKEHPLKSRLPLEHMFRTDMAFESEAKSRFRPHSSRAVRTKAAVSDSAFTSASPSP